MGFKKVSNSVRYVKYKECEEGQVIAEGVYLGTRQGQYGIQHSIKEADGIVVLNSSGQLNYLLKTHAPKGTPVRVTYAGMQTLETGRFKDKEAHNFELEVDEENKVEVDDSEEEEAAPAPKPAAKAGLGSKASKAKVTAPAEDDDEDLDEVDDEDSEVEEDEDEAPPAKAAAKPAKAADGKTYNREELLQKFRNKK